MKSGRCRSVNGVSGRKLRHLSAGSKRKVVGCNKKLVARNLGGKTPAVVLYGYKEEEEVYHVDSVGCSDPGLDSARLTVGSKRASVGT